MTQEEVDSLIVGDRFVESFDNGASVWTIKSIHENNGKRITICNGTFNTECLDSLLLNRFCFLSPKRSSAEKFIRVKKRWTDLKVGDKFSILSDRTKEDYYEDLNIWEKTNDQFDVENMKTVSFHPSFHVWRSTRNQNFLHIISEVIDLI